MPRKKPHKKTVIEAPKRNLVARAGTRSSAGPMKDKRKLSRQEQAIRDRQEIAVAPAKSDRD